jgi:hypothetical protein
MRKLLIIVFCSIFAISANAQHLRIYACAIANDSIGASMGGSSNGSGLYQSDDTGKTWKHLGWDNIKCYSMDMVQSSNGRILYEATGLGILRSTDYGEHWKQITDWRISEAMDVAVNQKNPNEIYIATAHGPWRSEDGGKTWEALTRSEDQTYIHRMKFDTSGRILFAGEHLYQFTPEDLTWHPLAYEPDGPDIYPGNAGLEPLWCISKITKNEGKIRHKTYGELTITGGHYGGHILEQSYSDGDDMGKFGGSIHVPIKDVASCAAVWEYSSNDRYAALLGTLGDGIFVNEKKNQRLPHRQIWTLKSFLVMP